MIDVRDLTIGDWVRHSFYEENMQIHLIEDNGRIGALSSSLSASCHIDNFEPIPITREILEKNGFVLVEGCLSKWKLECNRTAVYVTAPGREPSVDVYIPYGVGCGFGFVRIMYDLRIYAVHQLQHILRLVNFGKEIIL